MLKALYKMAASTNDKRKPITTSPYNVPSVDVTPDQPTFSLDTTFKAGLLGSILQNYFFAAVGKVCCYHLKIISYIRNSLKGELSKLYYARSTKKIEFVNNFSAGKKGGEEFSSEISRMFSFERFTDEL
jgi:hypothetical protein